MIVMDKVYGDFKKLHKHIIDTFENEIKEWEKFMLNRAVIGTEISSLVEQSDHPITLSKRIIEEFEKFGRYYHDEAIRICENIPELPSKFEDDEVTKCSPDRLMIQLKDYLNDVIGFSPLICNLLYVRDFLTNGDAKISDKKTDNRLES